MTYEETNTTWYFQNLWNSIKWIFVGFLLIILSIWLLWWNEGRTIKIAKWLEEWQKNTIEWKINKIDLSLNNKLVHIKWRANTKEILKDNLFFITWNVLKLDRKVEMYQWKEIKKTRSKNNVWGSTTRTTTYTYQKDWSTKKIDSSSFKEMSHKNPSSWPFNSKEEIASKITIGKIILWNEFVSQLNKKTDIDIPWNIFNRIKKKYSNMFVNIDKQWQYLYFSNSTGANLANPSIGDLRVSFSVVNPIEVSAIWKQYSNNLTSYTTKNWTSISLLQYGDISINDMYKTAQKNNIIIAWLLRIWWLLLMFVGFKMLFGLLETIAKVIPFLWSVADFWTSLIAFLLTIIVWGLVIIIAWFFVRPILSISLLLIIWLIVYSIIKIKKSNNTLN